MNGTPLLPFLTLAGGLVLGAALPAALGRRRRPTPGSLPEAAYRDAPLGVARIRDRQVVWANTRFAELVLVAPSNLPGAPAQGFHESPEAFQAFGREAAEAVRRKGAFRGEVHLRRADGTPFWAYLAGVPAGPGDDLLWFMEDVTGQVEARQDLAEVLSMNEKLIAASPSGILLYRSADGACVLANDAAARIFGGTRESLLGQNFRRIPSWKASGLREAGIRALAEDREQALACHFTSSFGNEVHVDAHFVPFLSRGERHLLLLADDVSGREQAFAALRTSEARYRVVVDTLNEGLALLDAEGRLTFCNGTLLGMGGYGDLDVRGLHYSEFVSDTDRSFLESQQIFSRPDPVGAVEVGLRRRDGTFLECRVSAAPVRDAGGGVTALAILVTDISATKAVERERERLMAELEQKNRELETLLYVASHDLRSPLVNIQGFSQRLSRSLEDLRRALADSPDLEAFRAAVAHHLQDRIPGSLEFIRASGAKMDAIINGLLTLSRAGRMQLRAEPLDMNAIVKGCSAALAWQFQSVEGSLQVEDLPPCVADPVQTAQVLSNLLDNAVKYRHRERPLRVRVSGRRCGDRCEYEVEDNGLGIPPEHRERIWEIFQRLDPQGPIPGDGLGLTLARRMAERNQGRLRLEPASGEGCRFVLELPAGSAA